MANHNPSKIEEAILILSSMEKDLDEVIARVSDKKKVLLNLAREEAERTKDLVIGETSKFAQEDLTKIEAEAEKEAEKIRSKGEEELKSLKTRIDQVFDNAVSLVVKAALGEV